MNTVRSFGSAPFRRRPTAPGGGFVYVHNSEERPDRREGKSRLQCRRSGVLAYDGEEVSLTCRLPINNARHETVKEEVETTPGPSAICQKWRLLPKNHVVDPNRPGPVLYDPRRSRG